MARLRVHPRSPSQAEAMLPQLEPLVAAGLDSAASALSAMTGRTIQVRATRLQQVPLAHLSRVAGDPEHPVVAIYLGVGGAYCGHLLLALSEPMALSFVDMLLDLPDGSTEALATLEVSALAEAGNVAGSAFLNVLANGAHLVILPTPPVVLEDMCGAILDTLAAELALHDQEDALVIEAQLTSAGQTVDAAFLVFPAPDMLFALAQGARDEVDGGNVDG